MIYFDISFGKGMSSRLNLLFEPCYCLTQHVMRSCHKCMRTRKSHGKYCMIRSSF